MKDGFIKVIAASPGIRVADCATNLESIKREIDRAADKRAALLVLPELCVTGYTCDDLFSQDLLRRAAAEAVVEIARYTAGKSLFVVCGAPLVYSGRLFNTATMICDGELLGVVPKSYLPNYGEFYDQRSFAPAPQKTHTITVGDRSCPFGTNLLFVCRENRDFVLGAEICEDLFVAVSPGTDLARTGATVIANLSASSELAGKADYRREVIRVQSSKNKCGYIYANTRFESTNDMVFSGHSLIAESGEILAENPPFGAGFIESEIDVGRIAAERIRLTSVRDDEDGDVQRIEFSVAPAETVLTRTFSQKPLLPQNGVDAAAWCESVLDIQCAGLVKRMAHMGAPRPVIGISGGLDSALALLVIRRAMGWLERPASDIIAISMPCFGTSERTRNNARKISELTGAEFSEIDITGSVEQHLKDIGHGGAQDVTFENAQARERTQVLMDVANQRNGLVIGTGDLSELALGWCTYNGDHMSMYSVNCGVPKTMLRFLIAHIAARDGGEMETLLRDILGTPVSPELLPLKDGAIHQKTEDVIGPYELQDFFLYYFLRWGFSPRKIRRIAGIAFDRVYTDEEIVRWLRVFVKRFFTQQYKRTCVPNGPQVCAIGLSPRGDWRMPSDAAFDLWMTDLEK